MVYVEKNLKHVCYFKRNLKIKLQKVDQIRGSKVFTIALRDSASCSPGTDSFGLVDYSELLNEATILISWLPD